MKIIVAVKQILDPRGVTVRRDKERIFVNREEYIIDPGSKAALEAALRVKDASPCEVNPASRFTPRRKRQSASVSCCSCNKGHEQADGYSHKRIPVTGVVDGERNRRAADCKAQAMVE